MFIKWKSLLYLGLFFLGVFCLPSIGKTMILDYTIPRYNASLADPDNDGIYELVCNPDTSFATDLHYTNIYRASFSGGGFRLFRQKDVSGRGGEADTLNVPDDGSYYVTAQDSIGHESCASSIVNGPLVSDVEITINKGRKIKELWFDIQGRKISTVEPKSSGVWFGKIWYENNVIEKRKKVIVK